MSISLQVHEQQTCFVFTAEAVTRQVTSSASRNAISAKDRFGFHPVKTGQTPTADQWMMIKRIEKPFRLRLGDDVHPSDPEKVFKNYNPQVANGIQWMSRDKYMAMAAYRRNGTLNPNRTKTAEEFNIQEKARADRNRPAKMARNRARMDTDPEFRAHVHARNKAIYQRNRTSILMRAKAAQKTPYGIIRRRLAGSIKRHTIRFMNGTNHRHSEGGKFLGWLAKRMGITLPDKSWHIDHIIPVCKFDLFQDGAKARINAPENVRWLTAEQNLLKGSKMPSVEEMADHLSLVREWRATL